MGNRGAIAGKGRYFSFRRISRAPRHMQRLVQWLNGLGGVGWGAGSELTVPSPLLVSTLRMRVSASTSTSSYILLALCLKGSIDSKLNCAV